MPKVVALLLRAEEVLMLVISGDELHAQILAKTNTVCAINIACIFDEEGNSLFTNSPLAASLLNDLNI